MKRYFWTIFALTAFAAFGARASEAQITITLPKIPKIKKDKPAPKTETPPVTNGQNGDGASGDRTTTEEESKPAPAPDKCAESFWLKAHLEDVAKRQEEVDGFTPGRGWLTSTATYDHLLHAVSPSARERWLVNSKATEFKDCRNLVDALDRLKAAAAVKLPQYVPDTKVYGVRNAAEERLMKGKINDLADHKIFYVGLQQANWLIDKNEFGIPKARYKRGLAWVRYVPNDHPYCRIYYINVIQDYAGGGTYGVSYGYFVRDELAGCPAGQ